MKNLTLIAVFFLVSFTKEISAKPQPQPHPQPFLYSTSKWLFQRLFSSNSSADHSTSNIEDLAEEGPIFHHNAHANKTIINNIDNNSTLMSNITETMKENEGKEQKEEENQSQVFDLTKNRKPKFLRNDEDLNLMNNNGHEEDINNKELDTTTEPETPGILHRKISKILNKLQLYSAVRSTIHNVRKQQNGAEAENINNLTSNDKLERILNQQPTNSYLPPENTTKEAETEPEDLNEENQDFDERYDEPFVFDDELETKTNKQTKNTQNKLSLETGNIGIHIMEIFGSIATIFLSAAYQVGNYANSLTSGTNQNLVTTKPIEGMGTTIKWKFY